MAVVEGHVRLTAAIIAGNDASMDNAASRLKTNLIAEAARHNLTAAFMRSFVVDTVPGESGTGKRVSDRVVYTTDKGALAINYGHFTRQAKDSTEIPNFVPGKHVFEKAMGRSAGK